MNVPKDAFRRFQDELAALEQNGSPAPAPSSPKAAAASRLEQAKSEFLTLRKRYQLSVADVVAFFPEDEGVGYLQELIAAREAKPARGRKRSS